MSLNQTTDHPDNQQLPKQYTSNNALGIAVFELLKDVGVTVDKNRLDTALGRVSDFDDHEERLTHLLGILGIFDEPDVMDEPDAAYMPLFAHHQKLGYGRIVQKYGLSWLFESVEGRVSCQSSDLDFVAKIRVSDKLVAEKKVGFHELLVQNLKEYKRVVVEAVVASFIINLLALAVSLFSMQVYDRVIPTNSQYTLIILASGVGLMIIFEAMMKFARSKVMDKMVIGVDEILSRNIFERLLAVRVDKMPNSVGSLAAQLRGYEQVRSFFTASTLFTLVDIPMSILFIILIAVIGSPIVAIIPFIAAVIGIILGLSSRKKIDKISAENAAASYLKTGILVETVEGMETIKAGSGNWKFLSKWLDVTSDTIDNDLKMRHANDNLNYSVQMLQQISYVGIVITGAFVVMSQAMTIGGLIACTILGGRILAPIMNAPNLLVQYSHAKAAKANIERLFELEQDNNDVAHPLAPSRIHGWYQCYNMTFSYAGNERNALNIEHLDIKAGERVAILGSIGSGKSTLLKILSGLYMPTGGHVLLDGLDISHISRESMSEQVGYLQQDHRLFQGTLRENLLIGMPAPPDDVIRQELHRTGLIRLVSGHSSGLDLPISEGGKGLSGGQKQLVAFTRLVLTKPSVWLLDEPTASMDNMQENQCLQVLAQELQDPTKTLIVSTHKMGLLALVNRIIIMADGKVVMDGPKQAVLSRLIQNEQNAKDAMKKVEQTSATQNIGTNSNTPK
ncbi:RTX-I toxin determinant B [Moraxella lacunata]|uniref:RTX-I toxin determinant B n=1 Tax=Moraxella lacunata TaxID=477 RepID=A0A378TWF1_MORLA|nr:ATP-binding cassette domain-containing protein [Moraxella lacunata]STZ64242.1 RTX-I toxin determinant B [Moraxella lacunata]